MGVYIAGFICALVLVSSFLILHIFRVLCTNLRHDFPQAGLVVAWIAYCMFIRERHKSEYYHYNISDIRYKNQIMSLNQDEADVEKEMKVGVLILPSHKRQRDEEYGCRPDYPESPAPVSPSTEKLIDVFNDGVEAYKDGIYEVDSRAPYHSDV